MFFAFVLATSQNDCIALYPYTCTSSIFGRHTKRCRKKNINSSFSEEVWINKWWWCANQFVCVCVCEKHSTRCIIIHHKLVKFCMDIVHGVRSYYSLLALNVLLHDIHITDYTISYKCMENLKVRNEKKRKNEWWMLNGKSFVRHCQHYHTSKSYERTPNARIPPLPLQRVHRILNVKCLEKKRWQQTRPKRASKPLIQFSFSWSRTSCIELLWVFNVRFVRVGVSQSVWMLHVFVRTSPSHHSNFTVCACHLCVPHHLRITREWQRRRERETNYYCKTHNNKFDCHFAWRPGVVKVAVYEISSR